MNDELYEYINKKKQSVVKTIRSVVRKNSIIKKPKISDRSDV